jgi:hypothetical protein
MGNDEETEEGSTIDNQDSKVAQSKTTEKKVK